MREDVVLEALVAFDFDEHAPGVLALIGQTVEGAHRNQRHCGICGQAPQTTAYHLLGRAPHKHMVQTGPSMGAHEDAIGSSLS